MKKKGILLVVLLLAVGFAAVTTTLFINGTTNIGTNKDDFDVYYSKAKVNGVEDNTVITWPSGKKLKLVTGYHITEEDLDLFEEALRK